MNVSKNAVVGVALMASLVLLGGCSSDATSPPGEGSVAPSSAPALRPDEELAAAVGKLATTTHKYTVSIGSIDILGQVDPAAKSLKVALAMTLDDGPFLIDMVGVGTDFYLKINAMSVPGLDGKKWYRVHAQKLSSFHAVGVSDPADPSGLRAFISTVTNVEKTAAGAYKGTFTMSKPVSGFTSQNVKALGAQAKDIPFEATVDAQGRFTGFRFAMPVFLGQKQVPVDITVTDHAGTVTIAKPSAAQVTEAPDAVYRLLDNKD